MTHQVPKEENDEDIKFLRMKLALERNPEERVRLEKWIEQLEDVVVLYKLSRNKHE